MLTTLCNIYTTKRNLYKCSPLSICITKKMTLNNQKYKGFSYGIGFEGDTMFISGITKLKDNTNINYLNLDCEVQYGHDTKSGVYYWFRDVVYPKLKEINLK